MANIFAISALNNLVSEYYCSHLLLIDYVTASEQKRNDDECTLAYYDNGGLITRTVKSKNANDVAKCNEDADGCLTLFGSCGGMFYWISPIDIDITRWDVSGVTNMRDMFCLSFRFNQDISAWDVSSVTDMHGMFREAESFNQNTSTWNISSVTNMSHMFCHAESFNQNISTWDVSNVTDMSYMFYGAKSFNCDVSRWCVYDKTKTCCMFDNASSFNGTLFKKVSLDNWTVAGVMWVAVAGFLISLFIKRY